MLGFECIQIFVNSLLIYGYFESWLLMLELSTCHTVQLLWPWYSGNTNFITIYVSWNMQMFVHNYIPVLANTKYYSFIKFTNTEYYSFMKIYEFGMPNTICSWKFSNTEYRKVFVTSKSTNTEYQIVLFGSSCIACKIENATRGLTHAIINNYYAYH